MASVVRGNRLKPIGVTAKVYVRLPDPPDLDTRQPAIKAGYGTAMRLLRGFIFVPWPKSLRVQQAEVT
ncbi:hypothetical protein GCM10028790_42170 [Micromonospora taraxaci]